MLTGRGGGFFAFYSGINAMSAINGMILFTPLNIVQAEIFACLTGGLLLHCFLQNTPNGVF